METKIQQQLHYVGSKVGFSSQFTGKYKLKQNPPFLGYKSESLATLTNWHEWSQTSQSVFIRPPPQEIPN